MDIVVTVATTTCTAAGSLAVGYALALIQHRWSIKDSGKSEVSAQERLVKFETLRSINGKFRNLSHDLMHMREGHHMEDRETHYYMNAKKKIASIREFARSESFVLGDAYVEEVHKATDIATIAIEIYAFGEQSNLVDRAESHYKFEGSWDASKFGVGNYLYLLYRESLDTLSFLASLH